MLTAGVGNWPRKHRGFLQGSPQSPFSVSSQTAWSPVRTGPRRSEFSNSPGWRIARVINGFPLGERAGWEMVRMTQHLKSSSAVATVWRIQSRRIYSNADKMSLIRASRLGASLQARRWQGEVLVHRPGRWRARNPGLRCLRSARRGTSGRRTPGPGLCR